MLVNLIFFTDLIIYIYIYIYIDTHTHLVPHILVIFSIQEQSYHIIKGIIEGCEKLSKLQKEFTL
jgi:hypothetical protein